MSTPAEIVVNIGEEEEETENAGEERPAKSGPRRLSLKERKLLLLEANHLPAAAPRLTPSDGPVHLGDGPPKDFLGALRADFRPAKAPPEDAAKEPPELAVIHLTKTKDGKEQLTRQVLQLKPQSPPKPVGSWRDYKAGLDTKLKARARERQREREERYREERRAAGQLSEDEDAEPSPAKKRPRRLSQSSDDEDFDPNAPEIDDDGNEISASDGEEEDGDEDDSSSEDEESKDTTPAEKPSGQAAETDFSGLRGEEREGSAEAEEEELVRVTPMPRQASPQSPERPAEDEEPMESLSLHLSPTQSQFPLLLEASPPPEFKAPSQLIGLCSGPFPDSQPISSARSDATVDIHLLAPDKPASALPTQDMLQTQEFLEPRHQEAEEEEKETKEDEEDSDIEETVINRSKRKALVDSDAEEDQEAAQPDEEDSEGEEDGEEDEDGDEEGEEGEGEAEEGEAEEDEEMAVFRQLEAASAAPAKGLKDGRGRLARQFYEAEAELSGSEEGSGDEEEAGLDELLPEEGDLDADLPSEDRLRAQLAKMANKQALAEDEARLGALKEALVEDEAAGLARRRRLRWAGAEDEDGAELERRSDDDDAGPDEEEEELSPGKLAFVAWRVSGEERPPSSPEDSSFASLGRVSFRKLSVDRRVSVEPGAEGLPAVASRGRLDFSELLSESPSAPLPRRESFLQRLKPQALAQVARSAALGAKSAEQEAGSAKSVFRAKDKAPRRSAHLPPSLPPPQDSNTNSLFDSLHSFPH